MNKLNSANCPCHILSPPFNIWKLSFKREILRTYVQSKMMAVVLHFHEASILKMYLFLEDRHM